MTLQVVLKNKCAKYILSIFLSKNLIHILHIAIDIKIYREVQTGANTQLGGLKLGRVISEYQGSLNEAVVYPPTMDGIKVINNIKKNDIYLFFVIL